MFGCFHFEAKRFKMDPVTLFGIAAAGTIVGVSFLISLKWLYSRHKAKRRYIESVQREIEPQPTSLRIRVPY